jgi:hypothetical protein
MPVMNQTGVVMTRLKDTHYTKQALKARGWNDRLIVQFLGQPDRTTRNRHRRGGPAVCWYEKQRVHAAESRPECANAQAARARKRDAARRAVETTRKRLRAWLEALEVDVPVLDVEALTRRAIAAYNAGATGPSKCLPVQIPTKTSSTVFELITSGTK